MHKSIKNFNLGIKLIAFPQSSLFGVYRLNLTDQIMWIADLWNDYCSNFLVFYVYVLHYANPGSRRLKYYESYGKPATFLQDRDP